MTSPQEDALKGPVALPRPQEAGKFPPSRFPLVEVETEPVAFDRIRNDPIRSQPWMQGARLPPTTLEDLGLHGKLSLSALAGGKTEWGTHVIVSDSHGNLFGFFSAQARIGVTDDFKEVFWLGGLARSKDLVRVDAWSPSYRFLFSLVWSFARDDRYQPSRETLEKARQHANLTESELTELLTEPKHP
ncbi:MAG: hypothetical protein ABIZ49_05560 [Opitutaceae bacterium]